MDALAVRRQMMKSKRSLASLTWYHYHYAIDLFSSCAYLEASKQPES